MYDEKKLNRFIVQQEGLYDGIVEELRKGEKRTHWIWFIFPQIKGFVFSKTSLFFNIESIAEAKSYVRHPVLGKRLIECCEILMKIEEKKINQILPSPDDVKLRSSMTLFAVAAPENKLFTDVLQKYFNGAKDQKTLQILGC